MAKKQFTLRCEEDILGDIKKDAKDNKRSANLHIETILEKHLKRKNKKSNVISHSPTKR